MRAQRTHGRYRPRTVVAAAVVGLGLAGCSGTHTTASSAAAVSPGPTTSTTTTTSLPPAPPVVPIEWSPCAGGLQCGTVAVPLDYTHPGVATLRIQVAELPAATPAQSSGTILFNPGGPAESGIQELKLAAVLLPPFLHQHFTVVSFDPRGAGGSARLDCGTTAPSVIGVHLLGAGTFPLADVYDAMVGRCAARFPAAYRQIDTTNTARDLDRIRQALGLPTLNFIGLSYGTLLGDAYAELYPSRVRAMILDGGVDPTRTLTQDVTDQAAAAEKALQGELSQCAQSPRCPLGPTPLATLTAIGQALTQHPASPGSAGGPPVTEGDLDSALLLHLTVPGLFNLSSFAAAALGAEHGDGGALRSMAENLWTDTDGSSLVDPYWALTCNDNPQRVAAGAEATLAQTMEAGDPGTGAFAVAYDMAGCASWPPPLQPLTGAPARGAPPILVIGGTGDPNTPFVWSTGLARSLGPGVGVLVTRVGVGHTAFLNGVADTCIRDLELAYLADLTVPPPGTTCTDPPSTG